MENSSADHQHQKYPFSEVTAHTIYMSKFLDAYIKVPREISLILDKPPYKRRESDGEHTYKGSVLVEMVAAQVNPALDLRELDLIFKVHDWPEIYADDTSIWADQAILDTKEEREEAARQIINTDSFIPQIYKDALNKYANKSTPEARFVYAFDKLEAILTNITNQGEIWWELEITWPRYEEMMIKLRDKVAQAPELLPIFDELAKFLEAHPEYFYQPELESRDTD